MRGAVEGLGFVILAAIVAGVIILIVSRRTHILNWRFGVFFESEERLNGEEKKEEPDAGNSG